VSASGRDSLELIRRSLARDAGSVRALVDRLSPVIERRVAAVLGRRGARGRDPRQELRDLTQAVFLSLFESDCKALRAWDPRRGSTLEGFVSLLALRQVVGLLRSGRTTPWPDDPTEPQALDSTARSEPLPEELVASREYLGLVLDAVREQLSPRGLEIFQILVVDQEPVEQAAGRLGLTVDAIYQWRSRLLKMVRDAASALSDEAVPRRIAEGSSSP